MASERKVSSEPPADRKETNASQPRVPHTAFMAPDTLFLGCPPLVRALITLPEESKVAALSEGDEVKLTNGSSWLWARIDGAGFLEPADPKFNATIVSTLPHGCAYNTGSRIVVAGSRIFAIRPAP